MLEVNEEDPATTEEAQLHVPVAEQPVISLQVITGSFGGSTIRVTTLTTGKSLHILVDSGSTHKFLDVTITRKLSCSNIQLPPWNVGIVNSQVLSCSLACHGFLADITGLQLYN